MTVHVPTRFDRMVVTASGTPARIDRNILASHAEALSEAGHFVRSRCIASINWAGEVSEAGTSYVEALAGTWTLSPTTSNTARVLLYAQNADVKITASEGATSGGVVLSTSGGLAQWETGLLNTHGVYSAGARLRISVAIRSRDGATARLYRLRIVESVQTVADLR